MNHLILTANSPGEVGSWVRSTVAEVKSLDPQTRVTVALVPCPFATGAEARVARAIEGVDQVWEPWQTMRGLVGLEALPRLQEPRGVVGYLGGELLHALALARHFRLPSVAYLMRPSWFGRFFSRLAVARSEHVEKAGQEAHWVGDLRVDGVGRLLPEVEKSSRKVLAFFPGSRKIHLRATMSVYLRVAELLPDWDILVAFSPFVTESDVLEAIHNPIPLPLPRTTAVFQEDRMVTPAGRELQVTWGRPYEVMARCDLALCIPGTNTAELACANIPFVVTLHDAAVVGGGGLFGLVDRLPLGPFLHWLRRRKLARLRFSAYPNQLAQEMIAPEILVGGDLGNLLETVRRFGADADLRGQVGQRLRQAMGPAGAARALAEMLIETCGTA